AAGWRRVPVRVLREGGGGMLFGYAWLAGCTAPVLPAPEVRAVDPDFAFNGDDETVTIEGRYFYPVVAVDPYKGGADVDKSFSAWLIGPTPALNRYEFAGVGITDDQHLTATLEAGLPKGTYTVEVEGPTGLRGKRVDGFTVTDTEIDRLEIDSDDLTYE